MRGGIKLGHLWQEFVNLPSPIYVATFVSHALLTLIVRLPAALATLFHRDDPNPSATTPELTFSCVFVTPSSPKLVVDEVALLEDFELKREETDDPDVCELADESEEIDSLRGDDP